MARRVYVVEGTDLVVEIDTKDASLASSTARKIKWIDPDGMPGEVAATIGSVATYLKGVIARADVVFGDWFFWAEAVNAASQMRRTFAEKVTVLQEGQEKI